MEQESRMHKEHVRGAGERPRQTEFGHLLLVQSAAAAATEAGTSGFCAGTTPGIPIVKSTAGDLLASEGAGVSTVTTGRPREI